MIQVSRIRPNRGIVIVRVSPRATKTAGGVLHIPETARQVGTLVEGEVVTVGPPRITTKGVEVASALKPGDRVLVSKLEGVPTADDRVYRLFREDQIAAVLEPAG